MLSKGLTLVLDMALASRESPTPLKKKEALIQGIFREDVIPIPFTRKSFPSPSWRHFWPRSRRYCDSLFRKAVRLGREGKGEEGEIALGRALHVLIDMGCPVHAQRVWHYLHDPFECYVEGHVDEISRLPLPSLAEGAWKRSPEGLVESLASAARLEQADRRQGPWALALRRLQLMERPRNIPVADQARRLIPLAAAHVRALLENYERETLAFQE